MSATLPLPLELTRPIELASTLEDSLKESFGVEARKYNAETQVSEDAQGVPVILNGSSSSSQESQSDTGSAVIDITVDIQIDDNDFDF